MTSRDGPLPAPLGATIGRLLAPVYGRVVAQRNRRFDAGVGVAGLDRPVVSVGNLSVGGTGKTPMVRWVCERLIEVGATPAIAMRGYKSAGGVSDEAMEYAEALPSVPVVAQPNRTAGLRALFATPSGAAVDAVVLDDGFQHRRIARDLDVVLIDCSRPIASARLLPAGWLREPMASLTRAGAVVLTHAERASDSAIDEARRVVAQHAPELPIAVCEHAWDALRVGDDACAETRPVDWLRGKRVAVACAIGNPGAFVAGVRDAGAQIAGEVLLRDHDAFGPAAVARVEAAAASAEALVVTEKDWVKIRRTALAHANVPVVRPSLAMRFRAGEDVLADRVRALVPGEAPA